MINVKFIAVVFNNFLDTIEFVQSLERMSAAGCEILCILIDNSDSKEIILLVDGIARDFEFVRVIRPGGNLGYFGAFNYYLGIDDLSRDDFVLLCNNDLIFPVDFCEHLLSANYEANVAVVCPDVVTFDGVHQNPHLIKRRNFFQRFKLDLYFSHYYAAYILKLLKSLMAPLIKRRLRRKGSAPQYVHLGIGACYVLLPSFFRILTHLNYPDFLYGEEAYLSKQVHESGGKLFYDPNLKILHKESASLSKLPSRVTYGFSRDGYWNNRKLY